MGSNANIDNEVQLTLGSLDGVERASAGPFFYTRLMARMESEQASVWVRAAAWLTRPQVALGLLVFLLVMNGLLLLNSFNAKEETAVPDYVVHQISYFESNPFQP